MISTEEYSTSRVNRQRHGSGAVRRFTSPVTCFSACYPSAGSQSSYQKLITGG